MALEQRVKKAKQKEEEEAGLRAQSSCKKIA